MRNIKIIIQYDGSRYHGWQKQPNAPTIQETVENAEETPEEEALEQEQASQEEPSAEEDSEGEVSDDE